MLGIVWEMLSAFNRLIKVCLVFLKHAVCFNWLSIETLMSS